MWNRVEDVASNQNLDANKFKEFVIKNKGNVKYPAINVTKDYVEVGTWSVDDLIRDFKKEQKKSID